MANGFNARMRCQQEWGWLLAIWLFLSGSASVLFLLYRIAGLPARFGDGAIGLLLLGLGVLLLEQGSPLRAWRALSGIGTSWLSRGVVFIVAFIVCATLGQVLVPDSAAARVATGGAVISAVMVALYPGLFLANNRSVPFWHTQLLPGVLVASSVMAASGFVLVASSYLPGGLTLQPALSLTAIGLSIGLVLVHLASKRRGDMAAAESVRLLTQTPLAGLFLGGAVFAGMVLPAALLLWRPDVPAPAGGLMLVGCLLLRYCIVRAGVYVPAPAVRRGRDFSRLNRTSSEFEREYVAAHRR